MKQIVLVILCISIANVCIAGEYNYPYTSFNERDPMKPLISEDGRLLIKEKTQFGDFSLQGITYLPEGSSVVINNELYSEGDVIEGYTVKKIDAQKVILEKGGEEFTLKWEVNDEK